MPDPTSSTPPRPVETADSGQGSPYKVCQELTIGELFDRAKELDGNHNEKLAFLERKVFVALEDGEAPSGGLVRVRMQRQVVKDGTVRWTPER